MIKANIKAAAFLLLSVVLFSQCTKIDTTSVGSGLIPGVDNINTFDTTFDIIANNFDALNQCDSIGPTDLVASGIINNNALFGSTQANMYFEFKPASFPLVLPTHDALSMVVDSVVLVLKYDHSYGDTNVMQKVKVYQLTDKLRFDSAYKTCTSIPVENDLLAEASFTPSSFKDSIHAFRENDANQLRIRMPDSLGRSFITNVSKLTTDSAFKEFFKGFAVIADEATGGEAINYFNLRSQSSRLSIYVRSNRDTVKDTSLINLSFTSSSGLANHIERQRGTSEITQYLDEKPAGDSLIFVQTDPAGSFARLSIPKLSGFPNSVIYKAELIIDQIFDPAVEKFAAPRLLYLDIPDSSGKFIGIPCDFTTAQFQNNFSYLGGVRMMKVDSDGHNTAHYSFNVSRYIQSVVTRREENLKLRLRAPFYIENHAPYLDRCGQTIGPFAFPANPAADGGVKLSGTNQTPSRMRLRLIYSKL